MKIRCLTILLVLPILAFTQNVNIEIFSDAISDVYSKVSPDTTGLNIRLKENQDKIDNLESRFDYTYAQAAEPVSIEYDFQFYDYRKVYIKRYFANADITTYSNFNKFKDSFTATNKDGGWSDGFFESESVGESDKNFDKYIELCLEKQFLRTEEYVTIFLNEFIQMGPESAMSKMSSEDFMIDEVITWLSKNQSKDKSDDILQSIILFKTFNFVLGFMKK